MYRTVHQIKACGPTTEPLLLYDVIFLAVAKELDRTTEGRKALFRLTISEGSSISGGVAPAYLSGSCSRRSESPETVSHLLVNRKQRA